MSNIFDIYEIFDVVKILRGNSNSNNNCTHLASDLVKYFKTGIKPIKASSTKPSTLKDFNVLINIDWIKRENDDKYLGITKSVVCLDNTRIPNIPHNIEPFKDVDDVYNIEENVHDIDSYTQRTISVNNINNVLRSKDISYGYINLGRCGEYVENCGHMIVYFSLNNNIWYVDCQLDDLDDPNKCIFDNLLDVYNFAHINEIDIDTFGEYIFYIPMNTLTHLHNKHNEHIEIKQEPIIENKRKINCCEHDKEKRNCVECGGESICIHKKRKQNCIECEGKNICIHKKQKQSCAKCRGSSVCIHGKRKQNCVECGGSNVCIHKKIKQNCIECNICTHKKNKRDCIICGGKNTCIHKKKKRNCIICKGKNLCKHNKIKYNCSECGGNNICKHKRNKHNCVECGGKNICKHKKYKYTCVKCTGKSICQHKKRKYNCIECRGYTLCKHYKQKQNCTECKEKEMCIHYNKKQDCFECWNEDNSYQEEDLIDEKIECELINEKDTSEQNIVKSKLVNKKFGLDFGNVCIHKNLKQICFKCKEREVCEQNTVNHKLIDEKLNKEFDMMFGNILANNSNNKKFKFDK